MADMVAAYEARIKSKKQSKKLTAKHYYGRAQFDPDEHSLSRLEPRNKLPLMQFAKNPIS